MLQPLRCLSSLRSADQVDSLFGISAPIVNLVAIFFMGDDLPPFGDDRSHPSISRKWLFALHGAIRFHDGVGLRKFGHDWQSLGPARIIRTGRGPARPQPE